MRNRRKTLLRDHSVPEVTLKAYPKHTQSQLYLRPSPLEDLKDLPFIFLLENLLVPFRLLTLSVMGLKMGFLACVYGKEYVSQSLFSMFSAIYISLHSEAHAKSSTSFRLLHSPCALRKHTSQKQLDSRTSIIPRTPTLHTECKVNIPFTVQLTVLSSQLI